MANCDGECRCGVIFHDTEDYRVHVEFVHNICGDCELPLQDGQCMRCDEEERQE